MTRTVDNLSGHRLGDGVKFSLFKRKKRKQVTRKKKLKKVDDTLSFTPWE